MWLLFRRKNKVPQNEADKALREAKQARREINSDGVEVAEIANSLREVREHNHFAEAMEKIITRHREAP
jgi:hypothetical protein